MYAYQVKECTWSFAGGGRQPLVPALVRVVEEEGAGGQSKAPSGFRGPSGTSRRDRARQHSIAIVYITK